MTVGAIVARILTQYSDKGSKQAQRDIQKLGKRFDAFAKRSVRAFGLATAAVGAFAIKLGKDAVKGAMEDQKAQIALATALRNTVGATDAAIASTVVYLDKLELASGVNNNELIPSLQRLVTATGDLTSAQQLQQIALDVSAGTNRSLIAVTEAFARALGGSMTALKRLAPTLDATIVKNKDLGAAFEFLSQAYGGQAAARAETLEFRMNRLRLAFDQALDSLGYAFIPVLEDLVESLTKNVLPQISKWIELNKTDLVASFKDAIKFATGLLKVAVAFGRWVIENTFAVKVFAAVIATMFVVGKIYTFILGLKGIASAFGLITVSANGATAATARFKATAAFLFKFAKFAGIFGSLFALGGSSATTGGYPAGTVGAAQAQRTRDVLLPIEARRDAARAGQQSTKSSVAPTIPSMGGNSLDTILDGLLKGQNKLNDAKKKQLSIEEKIIKAKLKEFGLTLTTAKIEAQATATAIGANLKRQAKIAVSPTVSLASQGTGAKGGGGISTSTTPQVQVNIQTPYGTKEDFIVDVSNNLKTKKRRSLGGGGGSPFGGMLID